MRSGTSGIALLGLLATMSHGGAAEACGQSPAPFYVVESQAPMGADTPLNAPLQVKLREEPTGPADNGFAPKLTLTIQGGDQAFATTPIGYDSK